MICIRTASRPSSRRGYGSIAEHNEWLKDRKLAPVEEITFKSADGTSIDGFLVKPVDYVPGKRYPTILRIHGGPVYQFSHEFMEDWQVYAANGYAVVAANPRGSSGRGFEFAKAIYADWGNKDGADVIAAVDHVVQHGHRGSRPHRRRRAQLRWHTDGRADRAQRPLQGRREQRGLRKHVRDVRLRHVHPRVRAGARRTLEKPRGLRPCELPVPARGPDQDADALPLRRAATRTCPASVRCRCTRR